MKASIFKSIGTVIALSIGGSIYAGNLALDWDGWSDEVDLPLFTVTPEAIFTNKIPLFNVNFINPNIEDKVTYTWINDLYKKDYSSVQDKASSSIIDYNTQGSKKEDFEKEIKDKTGMNLAEFIKGITANKSEADDGTGNIITTNVYVRTINGTKWTVTQKTNSNSTLFDQYYITSTKGSTDSKDGQDETLTKNKADELGYTNQLATVISQWYNVLRTIAIVGMMSVLVYIGIRILLSSTSPQKAKYKQLLGDWLVGLALLFTLQVIMLLGNVFSESISDVFYKMDKSFYLATLEDPNEKILGELKNAGLTNQIAIKDGGNYDSETITTEEDGKVYYYESDGKKYVVWPTNLMGLIRIQLRNTEKQEDLYLGYTIMYLVMVFYTIFFCWTYIKRVIYMAFLTLISPLVALTYPIDKVNDGSAQGFNYWFKEYMFNLLLQPMHLLIYTVLVISAIQFAQEHMLYALVALGFIASSEKIVRTMFNFSKASTPGVFAGPAGAAMTMTGMRWLFGHGPRGKGDGKQGSSSSGARDSEGNLVTSSGNRMSVREQLSGLASGEGNDSGSTDSQSTPTVNPSDNFGDNDFNQVTYQGQNEDVPSIVDNTEGAFEIDSDYSTISEGSNYGNGASSSDLSYQDNTPISREQRMKKQQKQQRNRNRNDLFGFYKDQMARKFTRKLENAQPARALGRFASRVATGATFGTLGLAAGIASGDVKNAAQYAGAGYVGGRKLGSDIFNTASNAAHVDGLDEAYKRVHYGEKYREMQANENQLKKAREESTIQVIQEKLKLSRADAKKKAEEMAKAYMEEGINDVNDWVNIEKMMNKKVRAKDENGNVSTRNYTRDEAIGGYKIFKRAGIEGKDKKKALEMIQSKYDVDGKTAQIYYRTAKDFDDVKND